MQYIFSNDGNWKLTGNDLFFLYKGNWHFVFTSYKIQNGNIADAKNKYQRFLDNKNDELTDLHLQAYLKT